LIGISGNKINSFFLPDNLYDSTIVFIKTLIMKKSILLLALPTFLVIYSCNKPEVVPPPTPDGAALDNFFESNLSSKIQTFTVDASTGGYVNGAAGTTIQIYPNTLLDASNNLVTGNVTVELIEIFDRATMMMTNKPTVGVMSGGDHSVLISGGEYFLSIKQNGAALHTDSYVEVHIPTSLTGGTDTGMQLFRGAIVEEELLWEFENDSIEIVADSMFLGGSYSILDGEWGWANVDRFYSDPNPKTTLLVELPEGYDMTNSEVFLTYDGEPTALAKLDAMTTEGYFSEHYGQIPIGLHVHVIAVTIIDDVLHYSIKAVTIAAGGIITITELAPTTQADLAVLINGLP